MAGLQAGPYRTIEDTMIILKMFFTTQAHHSQSSCDCAFGGRQDCTNEQNPGMFPYSLREQSRKGSQDRDIFCLQGRHRLPLGGVLALAYPASCYCSNG